MAKFDAEIAIASELINENGKQVTLRTFSDAAPPDSSQPWEPGSRTSTDFVVDAVLLDFEERYIDDMVVQRGDKKALIAGSSLTSPPKEEDLLIDGTVMWRIVNVKILSPNGQLILYTVQLRK